MDWYSYKIRNLVENLFARLKHFRDIATRFDKLKRNYTGVVALAYIDMVATMKCQQTLSEQSYSQLYTIVFATQISANLCR